MCEIGNSSMLLHASLIMRLEATSCALFSSIEIFEHSKRFIEIYFCEIVSWFDLFSEWLSRMLCFFEILNIFLLNMKILTNLTLWQRRFWLTISISSRDCSFLTFYSNIEIVRKPLKITVSVGCKEFLWFGTFIVKGTNGFFCKGKKSQKVSFELVVRKY